MNELKKKKFFLLFVVVVLIEESSTEICLLNVWSCWSIGLRGCCSLITRPGTVVLNLS